MTSSTLVLRDYQQDALAKALTAKRGTVKAATATGKTIIAIAWLKELRKRSLVIVPTQALIYQAWVPKLKENFTEGIGQYWAGEKHFGDTTVTTFASAASHPEMIDQAEAIVVDEIHHLGAQIPLKRILPRLREKEFVLGLSAVPERPDETHNEFLESFPICFELQIGEAMSKGYVAPLEVIDVPVEMTPTEATNYALYSKKIDEAFKRCGSDIRGWASSGRKEGWEGLRALSNRKKLLGTMEAKIREVLRIVRERPNEMVILFSESIDATEKIREALNTEGIKACCVHSKIPSWKNMETLQQWGASFNVLLSCRSLEEGIDVKEVSVGILVASGNSKRQLIQRIGRLVRPQEGKKASFYVVWGRNTLERKYIPEISRLIRE